VSSRLLTLPKFFSDAHGSMSWHSVREAVCSHGIVCVGYAKELSVCVTAGEGAEPSLPARRPTCRSHGARSGHVQTQRNSSSSNVCGGEPPPCRSHPGTPLQHQTAFCYL
jgi:hypothetical protein